MNVPLFFKIQDQLINISGCLHLFTDDNTLVFVYPEESVEIEYENSAGAERAFQVLQQMLMSKNLFLGAVD